ncbi:RNA methyltransferase [Rhizobium sp. CFBP 8762]|uniref:RNA methyltransferase n=1 Tax=Rhizobium sp. CFBP 8762 TaxID=2775279 RepID=UPI00177D73A1|nr:RNA methyltransferase [Rhizobium sp. CFBP 8762]
MSGLIRISDPDDPRIAAFRSIRERDLTGRDGLFIAEGKVVLRMLVDAHAAGTGFTTRSVLLLENRVDGLRDILDHLSADIPVYVASGTVFDEIAGFHMHRGILALGSSAHRPGRADMLDSLPASSLVLVACGLSNHDNIGSLFRNAAAFGADGVLLDETCCDPLYRKAIRVSVGAVLKVPFARGSAIADILQDLTGQGFELWGLSPRGAVDIRDIPATPRIALVMGTEGEGLPEAVMQTIQTARIRQRPGLDSLNVATATGIALHEVARLKGLV